MRYIMENRCESFLRNDFQTTRQASEKINCATPGWPGYRAISANYEGANLDFWSGRVYHPIALVQISVSLGHPA